MRLPNTAHTQRPWRIHAIAPDFAVEDVWALPTPGGAAPAGPGGWIFFGSCLVHRFNAGAHDEVPSFGHGVAGVDH